MRLLRVLWTPRRSSQSILKEINLEYSLEGLMLKLKLQYFGHLMQKTDSLEKTLMLGRIEGKRRRRRQRMRCLHSITNSMDIQLGQTLGHGERQGDLACCSPVQFSRSVVSDSWQSHELQHARPPCPSPTPGVHSNSRPSSR